VTGIVERADTRFGLTQAEAQRRLRERGNGLKERRPTPHLQTHDT
jgi:hypothetical protein